MLSVSIAFPTNSQQDAPFNRKAYDYSRVDWDGLCDHLRDAPRLISFFLSNRRLRVVLHGKSPQEYPVNAGVSQGSILGPTLFLLYINDLPDDVICDIAIYADGTTLYSKCDQSSDLW